MTNEGGRSAELNGICRLLHTQIGGVNLCSLGNTVVTAAVVETQQNIKMKTTLKLDFKFDSMTLVLYSPDENVVRLMVTQSIWDILDNLTCVFSNSF